MVDLGSTGLSENNKSLLRILFRSMLEEDLVHSIMFSADQAGPMRGVNLPYVFLDENSWDRVYQLEPKGTKDLFSVALTHRPYHTVNLHDQRYQFATFIDVRYFDFDEHDLDSIGSYVALASQLEQKLIATSQDTADRVMKTFSAYQAAASLLSEQSPEYQESVRRFFTRQTIKRMYNSIIPLFSSDWPATYPPRLVIGLDDYTSGTPGDISPEEDLTFPSGLEGLLNKIGSTDSDPDEGHLDYDDEFAGIEDMSPDVSIEHDLEQFDSGFLDEALQSAKADSRTPVTQQDLEDAYNEFQAILLSERKPVRFPPIDGYNVVLFPAKSGSYKLVRIDYSGLNAHASICTTNSSYETPEQVITSLLGIPDQVSAASVFPLSRHSTEIDDKDHAYMDAGAVFGVYIKRIFSNEGADLVDRIGAHFLDDLQKDSSVNTTKRIRGFVNSIQALMNPGKETEEDALADRFLCSMFETLQETHLYQAVRITESYDSVRALIDARFSELYASYEERKDNDSLVAAARYYTDAYVPILGEKFDQAIGLFFDLLTQTKDHTDLYTPAYRMAHRLLELTVEDEDVLSPVGMFVYSLLNNNHEELLSDVITPDSYRSDGIEQDILLEFFPYQVYGKDLGEGCAAHLIEYIDTSFATAHNGQKCIDGAVLDRVKALARKYAPLHRSAIDRLWQLHDEVGSGEYIGIVRPGPSEHLKRYEALEPKKGVFLQEMDGWIRNSDVV